MLRPSNSLLGSSRAAQRARLRAERSRAVTRLYRALKGLFSAVFGNAFSLLLLWAHPLAYLAASYFVIDLPARALSRRPAWGWTGLLVFACSVAVAWAGITRAARSAEPFAPVRPQFARAMLALSWIAGLLCTIGDVSSS